MRIDLLRVVGQRAFGAGHAGHAGLDHRLLGRDLVAHHADRTPGVGPMKMKPLRSTRSAKSAFSDEEAVAGMDRLGVGDLGGRDDRRHVEVALRRRRRADADRLVGQLHVLGVAVGLGVDDDRLDAHLAAGALDAQRDLAAIGDQDLLEHGSDALGCRAWRRAAPLGRRTRLTR